MFDFNISDRGPIRSLLGFVAGFLATLVFHQLTLALLWGAGLAPFGPFQTAPTQPFGVPAVLSLAFWGGVWGIAYALVDKRWFPQGGAYWATAFSFGAILPSLVALFMVMPLKGRGLGGWHPHLLVTVLLVNGAWGLGTGLILKWLQGRCDRWRVGQA